MASRQEIMENNRSLRNIKNELESLLEKGIITEDAFDGIHALLPAESPLSGATRATPVAARNNASASVASPPTNALAALDINRNPASSPANPPPAYNQTGPPALPTRSPAPEPPTAPALAHARALYAYTGTDARDVSFQKDDRMAVLQYMNDDWWMGRNERTGQEGIFPKTYVLVEPGSEKAAPYNAAPDARMYPGQGYGGPPAQQNPYNANVPPMAVAEQPTQGGGTGSAIGEQGKKFGKKLGNAAIFGAGATIGSNIVNSIF